jgi:hypothetical protein
MARSIEPSPLLTFTTTGAGDFSSSGRKACITRTTPKTLVSNTSRMIGPVTSPTPVIGPAIAALLTSTSRPPAAATVSAAAAATEASSVMSRTSGTAPSFAAAARPRPASRLPR